MNFIRINNLKNFIIPTIANYHPDSKSYLVYWREQMKRIIEGFWSIDDENYEVKDVATFNSSNTDYKGSKWRFAPPTLYFYGNFVKILHKTDKIAKTAPKILVRPNIRDLEWEIFYDILVCRGFSGFELDEEFSCCRDLLQTDPEAYIDSTCFNSKGEKKTYIDAWKYLHQLRNKPLGKPLYQNGAKNYMLLGSRELGKSYSIGNGIILHELVIDGRKEYIPGGEKPIVEIFVGSGLAAKSKDLMTKVRRGMENLAGTWKKGSDEEIPSPLFKRMSGTINSNGRWIHEYQKKVGDNWKIVGSKSSITHIPFTVENPEAAAGGRYTLIVCEEVGLTPNIQTIHSSNEAAQQDGTHQMGTSIYLGTGGNIEKVRDSEGIFRNPSEYNCLAFDDEWENSGKICRFIPAYYKDNEFKDKNGNTNVTKAIKHYEIRREEKKKNHKAYNAELMNYPLKPSEMFLSAAVNRFPTQELKHIYGDLIANKRLLNSSWIVEFRLSPEGKVLEYYSDKGVIRDYPYKNENGTDKAIEIFERPKYDETGEESERPVQKIKYGRYIAATDPVDDDGVEGSLQSTFVLDLFTDRIVAEYTARPRLAKDYYEQVRRLCLFYNAINLYENNKKGLFGHFELKNSLYLLAKTPEYLKDMDSVNVNTGNKAYGITMSNAFRSNHAIDLILDYLLLQAPDKTEGLCNMHFIRSVGLLQELIKFNGNNADRVSALKILMIYRQSLLKFIDKAKSKEKKERMSDDKFWSNAYRG